MALTQQQIEEAKAKYFPNLGKPTSTKTSPTAGLRGAALAESLRNSVKSQNKPAEAPKQPGFIERVGADIKKRGTEVFDTFKEAAEGKINPLETGVRVVGQAAAGVGDVIGEGISSAASYAPEPVKQLGVDILKTKAGQMGLDAIQSGVEAYTDWATKNPRLAKDLEGVVNIASILPAYKGAKAAGTFAKEAAEDVVETGIKSAAKVGGMAVDASKNVLTKASDVITPIESGVSTVLKNSEIPKSSIAEKFNRYAEQAEKAIQDYSQGTPMEIAGKEGETALSKLNDLLTEAGTRKSEALKIEGTKIVPNISESRKLFDSLLDERLGISVKDGKFSNMPGRLSLIDGNPTDVDLAKQVDNILKKLEPAGSTLDPLPKDKATLQMVNDAVDSIQGKLYERTAVGLAPINTRLESIIKNVIEDLNEKAKSIGGQAYRKANLDYKDRVEVRNILNKGLGIDGNKGAALMKQLFSPNGTMSRKLFAQIKEMTGIDLVQEATLAKFAMENIGDVRQASLLEQVLRGQGLKSSIIKKAVDKIQDPIGKAKRIIEKRD